MFEQATKLKLRFTTKAGNITVEDLWDIPLLNGEDRISLDNIAKALNKQIKEEGEESFVTKKSNAGEILQLKFDIVKHIISKKLAEKEEKEAEMVRKVKRENIANIIAAKENKSLEKESLTSLKRMLDEL